MHAGVDVPWWHSAAGSPPRCRTHLHPSDVSPTTAAPAPATRSLNVCYFHGAYESEAAVQLVLEELSGGQLWDRWAGGRAGRAGQRESEGGAACARGCCFIGSRHRQRRRSAAAVRRPGRLPACVSDSPARLPVAPAGCSRAATRSGRRRASSGMSSARSRRCGGGLAGCGLCSNAGLRRASRCSGHWCLAGLCAGLGSGCRCCLPSGRKLVDVLRPLRRPLLMPSLSATQRTSCCATSSRKT